MSATTWSAVLSDPATSGRDHIRGAADASVTLLEYGDYECPHCAAAHRIVNTVQTRMGNVLRFAFRHFPLTTVHPHAQQAAEAAEAAGAQERFWSMHDALFQHQQDLRIEALVRYAHAMGLNVAAFTSDITRHTHLPKVREDFVSGVMSGVNGTPAFYINRARYDGPWDLSTLSAALLRAAA